MVTFRGVAFYDPAKKYTIKCLKTFDIEDTSEISHGEVECYNPQCLSVLYLIKILTSLKSLFGWWVNGTFDANCKKGKDI